MERSMKVLNVAVMTAMMGAVLLFYYEAYLEFPVSKWEFVLLLSGYGFAYCSVARNTFFRAIVNNQHWLGRIMST